MTRPRMLITGTTYMLTLFRTTTPLLTRFHPPKTPISPFLTRDPLAKFPARQSDLPPPNSTRVRAPALGFYKALVADLARRLRTATQ